MTTPSTDMAQLEAELIRTTVVRLRSRVMALVFGMVGGTALFLATAILLARQGLEVGLHLSLLNNFFPGYSVTWPGAFIGLGYGTLSGAIVGWSVAWIYNRVADRRPPG